jgi:hypothetical protein
MLKFASKDNDDARKGASKTIAVTPQRHLYTHGFESVLVTSLTGSGISLSRDRSIVPSKLSFSVFGERLCRKSYNVVVFPFAFHIAVQQPLNPLWSRLLLCDHEPSQPSTVLCFMSPLPPSGEILSEFPSPRVILSFFPHPWPYRLGGSARSLSSRQHRSRDHGEY